MHNMALSTQGLRYVHPSGPAGIQRAPQLSRCTRDNTRGAKAASNMYGMHLMHRTEKIKMVSSRSLIMRSGHCEMKIASRGVRHADAFVPKAW